MHLTNTWQILTIKTTVSKKNWKTSLKLMHKSELIWTGNQKLTKLDGRWTMLLEGRKKKCKIESAHNKNNCLFIKKMFLYNLMKGEYKQEVPITFLLINKVKFNQESHGNLLKILARFMKHKRTDKYLLDKL